MTNSVPKGTRTGFTTGFGFVVLLATLGMLLPVSVDVALPAFPSIARALHAPAGMVQWTFSAFLLSFGMGQLITGALSDRHGRRPLLLFGLTVFVVSSLACALVSNVLLLVLLRFIEGAGASVGVSCMRAIIGDVQTDVDRAASLQAYVTTVSTVAIMLAPLIGAGILSVLGWRWIFGFLAVAGVAVLTSIALFLPETSPQVSDGVIPGYRRVLRLPRTVPVVGFMTFAGGSYLVLLTVAPFLLTGHFSVPLALFLVASAMVLGNVTAGRLVKRLGAQRLAGYGVTMVLVACVVNCAVELLHPSAVGFVATMAFFAFSIGIGLPMIVARLLIDAGTDSGAASGILGSVQMVGGAGITWSVTALPWKLSTSTGLVMLVCGSIAVIFYGLSYFKGAALRKKEVSVPQGIEPAAEAEGVL